MATIHAFRRPAGIAALAPAWLGVALAVARAQHVDPPTEPVDFALEETSGRTRTLSAVRGRVVFLFYEDRAHADLNRDFKHLLHRFLVDNGLEGETTTYAIANLGAIGPGVVRDVVRAAVRAVAGQYGIQILLDWDGALRRPPFSFRDADANVAIVDRAGRMRWRHAGAIGETERRSFFRMLRQLLREPAAPPP